MENSARFQIDKADLERIVISEEDTNILYRHSTWDDIKNGFLEHKRGIISLVFLMLVIVAALCAPLTGYDPYEINAAEKFMGISAEHLLGTDEYGRDYLTRTLYGARVSMMVGLFSMIICVFIGTVIGTVSGYLGGKVDTILMRMTDVFLSIPAYLIALVLNMLISPSLFTLIMILSLFSWPFVARITRAQTMTLKQRDFVLASKNLGAGNFRIIFHHIIPNMVSSISVAATNTIAGAILAEAFLSYLGLGVQLPQASWGSMLQSAQEYMLKEPILAIVPGVLILCTVLSFNIIGDVLEKAMEPKMNH